MVRGVKEVVVLDMALIAIAGRATHAISSPSRLKEIYQSPPALSRRDGDTDDFRSPRSC